MTPEARLVSEIREFLREGNQEKTPELEDLAEQYADICIAVNERLLKCSEFLDKGMRSEAVHEAQVPPPLIGLVDTLNFREVTKWRNICSDYEMRVVPALRLDIVDQLRAESAKEQSLSPLLKEYRRLVHQGSRDEVIRILHRIREHDVNNPVWVENLTPLEQQQMEVLVREVKAALREKDLDMLRKLYADMTDPQRVVRPPQDIVNDVQVLLDATHREEALGEAKALVDKVQAAHSARDESGLSRLLAQWQQLADREDLELNRTMITVVAEARHWLDSEREKVQKERDFREAVGALGIELDRPVPERARLADLWRRVNSFDREPPAELGPRVSAAIAMLDKAERARKRRRSMAITAAAALVLIVAGVASVIVWRARSKEVTVGHLRALFEREDYAGVHEYLARLEKDQPGVFFLPDVQQIRQKTEEVLQQREGAKQAFEAAMAQLEEVRKDGFVLGDAQIAAILARARELAKSPESEAELMAWEMAREADRQRKQTLIDTELTQILDLIERALGEKVDLYGDFDREARAVEQIRRHIARADAAAPKASQGLRQRIAPFKTQVETWSADLTKRRQEIVREEQRRDRTVNAIEKVLPDIGAYGELMTSFAEDFPQDQETPAFRRVLGEMELYSDAVALANERVGTLPLSERDAERMKQDMAKLPGVTSSIWHTDMKRCVDYAESLERAKAGLAVLKGMKTLNLKVLYRRPLGDDEGEWEPIYYTDTIGCGERTLADGTRIEIYGGKVYNFNEADDEPWVAHMKLTTDEWDVKMNRNDFANQVPHGRFVNSYLAHVPDADKMENYLFTGIASVVGNEDMQPIPKVRIIARLLELAERTVLAGKDDVQRALKLFAGIDVAGSKWMNTRNPDTRKTNDRILAIFAQLPDFSKTMATIERQRSLLAGALSRRVAWAGRVRRSADGKPEVVMSVPGRQTAWIIMPDPATRRRRFMLAARRARSGRMEILPGMEEHLHPWQVLFAPSDGRTCEAVLTELEIGPGADVQWPTCWPANALPLIEN